MVCANAVSCPRSAFYSSKIIKGFACVWAKRGPTILKPHTSHLRQPIRCRDLVRGLRSAFYRHPPLNACLSRDAIDPDGIPNEAPSCEINPNIRMAAACTASLVLPMQYEPAFKGLFTYMPCYNTQRNVMPCMSIIVIVSLSAELAGGELYMSRVFDGDCFRYYQFHF
jgi:hypothetical protein